MFLTLSSLFNRFRDGHLPRFLLCKHYFPLLSNRLCFAKPKSPPYRKENKQKGGDGRWHAQSTQKQPTGRLMTHFRRVPLQWFISIKDKPSGWKLSICSLRRMSTSHSLAPCRRLTARRGEMLNGTWRICLAIIKPPIAHSRGIFSKNAAVSIDHRRIKWDPIVSGSQKKKNWEQVT